MARNGRPKFIKVIFLQPSNPDNDGGAAPSEPGPSKKKRQRKVEVSPSISVINYFTH